MSRRLHVAQIHAGVVSVDASQLHHARNVLRLSDGALVELFDDVGRTARGRLTETGVHVDTISDHRITTGTLTVAAAVPKGDRADWMVEKLSELGVSEFVPLACERSVVLPEGKGKRSRWERIAIESAKQSRRAGVMQIGPLAKPLGETFGRFGNENAWYLSTASKSVPIGQLMIPPPACQLVYVGPEGGWTERECAAFDTAGVRAVRLTDTILRIETAAVAAAAILRSFANETTEGALQDNDVERGS